MVLGVLGLTAWVGVWVWLLARAGRIEWLYVLVDGGTCIRVTALVLAGAWRQDSCWDDRRSGWMCDDGSVSGCEQDTGWKVRCEIGGLFDR